MLFQCSDPWKSHPGLLYGMRQPTLVGQLQIMLPADFDPTELDAAMRQLMPDSPAYDSDQQDPLTAMAGRALFWQGELQRLAGVAASHRFYCQHLKTDAHGVTHFQVAIGCVHPTATMAALRLTSNAIQTLWQASKAAIANIKSKQDEFNGQVKRHACLGTNRQRFLAAADRLDIPAYALTRETWALGYGRHTRWLDSSLTDQTPALSVKLARDKFDAASLLRLAGLPAPRHARAGTPEQAVLIAQKLGYPVVVKPADCEQGNGVSAGLKSDAAVLAAFQTAREKSKNVLVEKHFHGQDHRLTILHGRLIKTTIRLAGGVQGDGRHSVEQLLTQALQTPQMVSRAHKRGRPMLSLDAEALDLLGEQQLSPTSIPDASTYVLLRRRSNVSAGGTTRLIDPSLVHPDNARLAMQATELLRLDLAGIDLLIPDISVSWLQSGALICEVNAQPQIGLGSTPAIYEEILKALMANGTRIPVDLILDAPATPAQPAPEAGASSTPEGIGSSSRSGVWLDGRQVSAAFGNSFAAARAVLSLPGVRRASCYMSASDALKFGLPADRFDRIVVHASAQADTTLVDALSPHTQNLTLT